MTPVPAPVKPMNEFTRILNVFVSPAAAFADILERPRWIIPVILLTICSLALVITYSQHIGWERLIRQSMEQSSRVQSMSAEQRDQAIANGVKFGSIIGYVQATIGPTILLLVTSGVLMFIANNLVGTHLRYAQMLGITGYAFLTGLVSVPLTILVMFLKSPEDFDLRNPLAFNIGAFLSPDSPKWLASLASSFDLFSFWTMLLLAIGISVAGRKLSVAKALTAVLVPWVLWVGIKTAWTGMFS